MEIDGDQVENLLSYGDYKNGKPDSVPILPNRKALVILEISLVVGFGQI